MKPHNLGIRIEWPIWMLLPVSFALSGCQTMQRVGDDFDRAVAEIRGSIVGSGPSIELPPAQQPNYQVGKVLVYNGDRVRQIASLSDSDIQWQDRDGPLFRTTKHFFLPRIYQDFRNRTVSRTFAGNPEALWPLTIGNQVEFVEHRRTERKETRTVDQATRKWRCSVVDAHVVETPAGSFDSYRVTCRSYREGFRSIRSMSPVQIVHWDFAPAIGHYIRRESWSPSSNRRRERTLSAALPASLATPQRIDALLERLAKGKP